ncbi:MAG: hypothetical protein GQ580_00040, partial [Candidatus Thorarchaeota archaeon]|nr:hypothetical protein [Candidatus Thorarchaeota archaeon]
MAPKKTYCKFVEAKLDESGIGKIVIDPVFGSKLELAFNGLSEGSIPERDAWVHVVHENGQVLQIISNGDTQDENAAESPPTSKPTRPTGPTRKVRGEVLEVNVSESSGFKSGTVTAKLQDMDLKMMIGPNTQGALPPIGTTATFAIEDTHFPRVLEISISNELITGPAYTPVPQDRGAVRWPKACMGCGDTNLSELKMKPAIWEKTLELAEWRKRARAQGAKDRRKDLKENMAVGWVLGGAVGAVIAGSASIAGGHGRRGKFSRRILHVTMYLCPSCSHADAH